MSRSASILVTGAAGQLGRDVVLAAESGHRDVAGFDRAGLDLSDASAVGRMIESIRPGVVVNCAAYTAVDDCETNEAHAHLVNEQGVRNLGFACASIGAHLVHLSTDYVFDGTLGRAYREDDMPNPQSVYGRSKLAGEEAAIDVLGDDVTIVRTSWVCGEHGANMVKLVRRLAATGAPMAFVDDQYGCPTFAADLAPSLLELAEGRPGGVFHLTNAGAVSWYEFVGDILEASGHARSMVSPIATDELDPPRPAPRPMNSELENARWASTGRTPLRNYREALSQLVHRLA